MLILCHCNTIVRQGEIWGFRFRMISKEVGSVIDSFLLPY